MVFQWVWQSWTITIECFLGVQPLKPMVFRWFSKFWGQWSTMVYFTLCGLFLAPFGPFLTLFEPYLKKTPFLALVNEFCLGQNDLLYVLKRPLQIFNGFWGDHHHWMFLGGLTIAINGFTMVFWCCYHRFQWFSMVPDHWSNDAMVSMDRCGLRRKL